MANFISRLRGAASSAHPQTPAPVGNASGGQGQVAASAAYGRRALADSDRQKLAGCKERLLTAASLGQSQEVREAMEESLRDMCELRLEHREAHAQIAECINMASRHWAGNEQAETDFLAFLARQSRTTGLSLARCDAPQLIDLNELLTKLLHAPEETVLDVLVVARELPPLARERVELDVANAVIRAVESGSGRWWKGYTAASFSKAIGQLSDAKLRASVGIDFFAALLNHDRVNGKYQSNPHLTEGLLDMIAGTAEHIDPARAMAYYRRLRLLGDNLNDALQRDELPGPRYLIAPTILLVAAAQFLARTGERTPESAELVQKLLAQAVDSPDASILRVDCFGAAIALANYEDASVGLQLHEYLASIRFDSWPPKLLIRLGVMSFHLDAGKDSSHFSLEIHEPTHRTVEIEYPAWLVELRGLIPEVLSRERALQQSQQYSAISGSLVSSAPFLTSPSASHQMQGDVRELLSQLIEVTIGPRITTADWPMLCSRLYAELTLLP